MRRLAVLLLLTLGLTTVACSTDESSPQTTTTAVPGASTTSPVATTMNVPNAPVNRSGSSDQGTQGQQQGG
jgi:hypothetical protein